MGFLDFFSRASSSTESVVLIDIGTSSITGGYVSYRDGEIPTILYTQSQAITSHNGELEADAMLRALKTLGETLIREGAPVLARATGSGTADKIIVSVDAPWQETTVHTERFESEQPFVFSESMVTKRLKETRKDTSEKMLVDESIVGTLMNGYGTSQPYGKKASHAAVIVLTSLIETRVASGVVSTLEHLFHSKNILPIAGSSLRYQAIRAAFPHEHDLIILDATNEELSSISLVRKGLIVSLIQAGIPARKGEWISATVNELAELAKQYPLPRTIFLLARTDALETLRSELSSLDFNSLWLSDNPPRIVSVVASHMSTVVRQTTEQPADIILILMALYYSQSRGKTTPAGEDAATHGA